MAVLDAECLKDLAIFVSGLEDGMQEWYVINAVDMVVIPLYIFVLMELVKPGWLSWRKAVLHEASFVLPLALFVATGKVLWFDVLTTWGAIYGSLTYVLTFFFIARYHRQLKEHYSYQENINLNWLRAILTCFFLILVAWTVSCYMVNANFDNVYMLCSLAAWMFVSYFVYRHESVMEELNGCDRELPLEEESGSVGDVYGVSEIVRKLFEEEQLYLDPKLKLSDVARHVGTNRTYLSRFFNQEQGQTFYDYVNGFRIRHAEELLKTTSKSLPSVALESGFNCLSTFRRVFANTHGCSPIEYRNHQKANGVE